MVPRKIALPNNGSSLNRNFAAARGSFADPGRNANRQLATTRSWARRGKRQNGEGFGGGRIVGK
jgi:hypothetical protein